MRLGCKILASFYRFSFIQLSRHMGKLMVKYKALEEIKEDKL